MEALVSKQKQSIASEWLSDIGMIQMEIDIVFFIPNGYRGIIFDYMTYHNNPSNKDIEYEFHNILDSIQKEFPEVTRQQAISVIKNMGYK